MLYKLGGFLSGTALSTTFVVNMDDLIYQQLRRNVILPFKQTFFGAKPQINLEDVLEIGSGTANFVSQFKPHAIGKTNVKTLLINDEDYATPQDHYFSYINKRQALTHAAEKSKELEIMKGLGLEIMLPPEFNVETGRFEEPQLVDDRGQIVNAEEADIFELARLRGTSVKDLKELSNSQYRSLQNDQVAHYTVTGQKHSKKDYKKLEQLSVGNVINMAREDRVSKPFEDEHIDSIVKVQKKKKSTTAPSSKQQQQNEQQDLSMLLDRPQDINYEKAMKLYESQSLEAKEITQKDKRRLRRLKRKASQQTTEVPPSSSENSTAASIERQTQDVATAAAATSIKIEQPLTNDGIFTNTEM